MQLLLGSASPRRAQLLGTLALPFEIAAADIDETPRAGEAAAHYVERMAREKASALRERYAVRDFPWILTADTTVIVDGESFGKPESESHARSMLGRLSGRSHTVATAVCLCRSGAAGDELIRVETRVEFVTLSDSLINAYLATDEPWDKAGGYALQGIGASLVRSISGSVSNVIGLPLAETRELLIRHGVAAGVGPASDDEREGTVAP